MHCAVTYNFIVGLVYRKFHNTKRRHKHLAIREMGLSRKVSFLGHVITRFCDEQRDTTHVFSPYPSLHNPTVTFLLSDKEAQIEPSVMNVVVLLIPLLLHSCLPFLCYF